MNEETNDLLRVNNEEIKTLSDIVIGYIVDYEYKFAYQSKRFDSVMLCVIAVSLVYIAFNI